MSPLPPDFKPLQVALPWYRSASKLVTAAASTGAALVSIFSFLYSFGVIGEPESHKTVGNFGATWLGVSPAADTAHSIGDTIHLAATVTDKSGSVLVGIRPKWTSDNLDVATVLPDGSVIAKGPGSATIIVTVADLAARSRVVVRQSVNSVSFGPDSTIVLGEGERRPLRVRPLDGRGHLVMGVQALWRVSDTSIAVVDSLGVFIGRMPGKAIVSATAGGAVAHAPLTVIPVPAAIALVSGGDQRAKAGAVLPHPITLRVTSRRGKPVEGAVVRFRGDQGDVSTEPRVALTDSDGRARVTWTLADVPGVQTLLANVEHVDSALAITAEVEPVAANTRMTALSTDLSGPAASRLPQPVIVRVTDSTARVLSNIPVSWTALDGGRVDALSARTDSIGEARANWTLGPNAGVQRLRLHVGTGRTVPPLTVTASALAGAPARVAIIKGDRQRARAGAELAQAIVIRVTDRSSNPVAGAPVFLAASAGTVIDTALKTDSSGVASARWTLGRTAGLQTLTVRVDTAVPPVRAVAKALPGAPANLSFHEPPVEGPIGRPLPDKVVAVVTDVYGNPVPDAVVGFLTRSGGVTPSRAAADTAGRVRVTWTLGSQTGEQSLMAVVRGTDVESKLLLQAVPRSTAVQAGAPKAGSKPPAKATSRPASGKTAPSSSGASKRPPPKASLTKPGAAKKQTARSGSS